MKFLLQFQLRTFLDPDKLIYFTVTSPFNLIPGIEEAISISFILKFFWRHNIAFDIILMSLFVKRMPSIYNVMIFNLITGISQF